MAQPIRINPDKVICHHMSKAGLIVGQVPANSGIVTKENQVIVTVAEAPCVEKRCANWNEDFGMCSDKLIGVIIAELRYDHQPPLGPKKEF
ncbi:MAG: hypothetical protein NTV06_06245 [candidate division Zixibacteria bacterium]|nr:hypothetical protein [candidate division Zixibacteria bacterium]